MKKEIDIYNYPKKLKAALVKLEKSEISMFGDKNSKMDVLLGYDLKDLNRQLRYLLFTLFLPFIAIMYVLILVKFPGEYIHALPLWVFYLILSILGIFLFVCYYKINMPQLAHFLMARDLKKELEKNGFKQ